MTRFYLHSVLLVFDTHSYVVLIIGDSTDYHMLLYIVNGVDAVVELIGQHIITQGRGVLARCFLVLDCFYPFCSSNVAEQNITFIYIGIYY